MTELSPTAAGGRLRAGLVPAACWRWPGHPQTRCRRPQCVASDHLLVPLLILLLLVVIVVVVVVIVLVVLVIVLLVVVLLVFVVVIVLVVVVLLVLVLVVLVLVLPSVSLDLWRSLRSCPLGGSPALPVANRRPQPTRSQQCSRGTAPVDGLRAAATGGGVAAGGRPVRLPPETTNQHAHPHASLVVCASWCNLTLSVRGGAVADDCAFGRFLDRTLARAGSAMHCTAMLLRALCPVLRAPSHTDGHTH